MTHEIIWLMGPVGAGKTSMAREAQGRFGGIVLDGDEWIEVMAPARFGKRPKGSPSAAAKRLAISNNERIARMARVLSRQMTVYVAVVAPNDGVRRAVTAVCHPVWVWVDRPGAPHAGAWQTPVQPHLHIVVGRDEETLSAGAERIGEIVGLV